MTWDHVCQKVENKLKSVITYAKIYSVVSIADYIDGRVSEALIDKYMILVSPPDENAFTAEPMINGLFRKHFHFQIAVVVKSDPSGAVRIKGVQRNIADIQEDIRLALEHSRLDGTVDNRAGTNFEAGWTVLPQEDKSITVYTTIYTVTKTER